MKAGIVVCVAVVAFGGRFGGGGSGVFRDGLVCERQRLWAGWEFCDSCEGFQNGGRCYGAGLGGGGLNVRVFFFGPLSVMLRIISVSNDIDRGGGGGVCVGLLVVGCVEIDVGVGCVREGCNVDVSRGVGGRRNNSQSSGGNSHTMANYSSVWLVNLPW